LEKQTLIRWRGMKGMGRKKRFASGLRSSVANWPIFGRFETEKAEEGLNS
jgi:hypothetical protein